MTIFAEKLRTFGEIRNTFTFTSFNYESHQHFIFCVFDFRLLFFTSVFVNLDFK